MIFLASNAFFIDSEDQAKVMSITFSYKLASGSASFTGTSAGSFGVAIWDVTNSAWIMPVGVFSLNGSGNFVGSFQTTSNSTQYRLVLYNANATSGAATLYVDDFTVGPAQTSQQTSQANAIDWSGTAAGQAVTANTTNIAFTTVKDSSGAWNGTQYAVMQAGDYLVSGNLAAAAGTAGIPQVYVNGSVNSSWSTATAGNIGAGTTLLTNLSVGALISLRCSSSQTIVGASMSVVLVQPAGTGPAGQVVAMQVNQASPTATITSSVSLCWKFTATPAADTNSGFST